MRRYARGLFGVAVCLLITGTASAADSLTIRFSDLDEYAQSKSLGAAAIAGSLALTRAERGVDLQRSNPELAIDHQGVDGNEETQITLGKSFEMPWVTMKRRSGWSDRVRAAEFTADARSAELLGELKTGYVSLWLVGAQVARMNHLREVITDASHAATLRHSEGQLSGVEDHLIQMVVISLQAAHQAALGEQREIDGRWRALMGLGGDQEVALATPVVIRPVALAPAQTYIEQSENRPGHQSRLLMQEALAKQASAERGRIFPSIGVYGGYKTIESDYDGYVAGVSLSLPLLSTNRAEAKRLEIERQLTATETAQYRAGTVARIRSLVRSIRESGEILARSAGHFDEDMAALDDLLYSYEEGWINLNDLLNAIQIEVDGLTDFYAHSIRYYRNVFELEAITGATLVTFE